MFVSFRVTQLYETGACVYVYFSINWDKLKMEETVDIYEEMEARIREAVLAEGGSISHHHGVGKLRKRFMDHTATNLNRRALHGIKSALDPTNVFGVNNTFYAN